MAWRDSISRTETLLNACVKKGRKVAAFDNRSRKIPPLRVPLNTGSRIGSSATLSGPLNFLFETSSFSAPSTPWAEPRGGELISQSSGGTFRFVFRKGIGQVVFGQKKNRVCVNNNENFCQFLEINLKIVFRTEIISEFGGIVSNKSSC